MPHLETVKKKKDSLNWNKENELKWAGRYGHIYKNKCAMFYP